MNAMEAALRRLNSMDAQARIEVIPGVQLRRKENGIPVLTIHYSADPDRNPATPTGAAWFETARAEQSSQSAWDREQEIQPLAGGGERVFGRVLGQFHDAVVITREDWFPDPRWDVVAGFDHGKTNATALLKCYVDFTGNLYFAGEYYSMARKNWANDVAMNAPEMLKMPDLNKMRWCVADPSIFPDSELQKDGTYASVNTTYRRHGVNFLKQFEGERSDLTFVERVLSDYWRDLEHLQPKLFIVCRNESDRIQPGLHPYDCPNLLWELNRAKRAQLTARQLLSRNPTENIVDKWNHARDAMKYIIFTVRKPAEVPLGDQLQQVIAELNPTSAAIAAQRFYAEKVKTRQVTSVSMRRKARMR
ncbi:MAG TPA: hypothetical protein VGG42_09765 [Acidobacteriaceae bacterium]|jgi:hypothetical protein